MHSSDLPPSLPASLPSTFSIWINPFSHWTITWTPRLACGVIGGYYSLGLAYQYGVMNRITDIAVVILLQYGGVGYIALGALMPTIHWYAAIAVRVTAAVLATALFEIIYRISYFLYRFFSIQFSFLIESLK